MKRILALLLFVLGASASANVTLSGSNEVQQTSASVVTQAITYTVQSTSAKFVLSVTVHQNVAAGHLSPTATSGGNTLSLLIDGIGSGSGGGEYDFQFVPSSTGNQSITVTLVTGFGSQMDLRVMEFSGASGFGNLAATIGSATFNPLVTMTASANSLLYVDTGEHTSFAPDVAYTTIYSSAYVYGYSGYKSPTIAGYQATTITGTDSAALMIEVQAAATPTNTPTATPTWSATSTITPTWTKTATPTWSPTSTWTPTATPSDTSTFTITPTNTPTWTQTWTPTYTPTPTDTPTASPTVSPTPTWTPTISPSDTSTYTVTPTATPSASPTSTWTPTPTPSYTGNATMTPTPCACGGCCTSLHGILIHF